MFAEDLGFVDPAEFSVYEAIAAKADWVERHKFKGHYFTAEASIPGHKRSFFIKIPAKAQIGRHVDHVHERTEHVVIETNVHCVNGWVEHGEDLSMHMKKGHRYLVDRNPEHWAINNGSTDRIHLLLEG